MNRRKSSGRITAEEANELFQKPLELLDQPGPSLDPPPATARAPAWAAHRSRQQNLGAGEPRRPNSSRVPSAATGTRAAGGVSPFAGMLQAIRSAAERLLPTNPREDDRPRSSPSDSSTADLATRLEKSLVEASCLAAELQRRHREALAEHQRALSEIRDMVTILVEQVDRSAATSASPGTTAETSAVETRPPVHIELVRQPERTKRRTRLAKSVGDGAS